MISVICLVIFLFTISCDAVFSSTVGVFMARNYICVANVSSHSLYLSHSGLCFISSYTSGPWDTIGCMALSPGECKGVVITYYLTKHNAKIILLYIYSFSIFESLYILNCIPYLMNICIHITLYPVYYQDKYPVYKYYIGLILYMTILLK